MSCHLAIRLKIIGGLDAVNAVVMWGNKGCFEKAIKPPTISIKLKPDQTNCVYKLNKRNTNK
jgi:hypothetical protein